MKIKLFILFTILTVPNLLFGQSKVVKYTQVLIQNDIDSDLTKEIRDAFYLYPDVQTSRMDPTTHLYLCVYKESNDFNEEVILAWFENRDIIIRCYFTDVFKAGELVSIKDTNCE